jgi:hypothetical protein
MTQRPREPVMTVQPTHDLSLAALDRRLPADGIWG